MRAKRYPNLYQVKWTTNWVFRKNSSAKGAEFCASTGIPATEANAAQAYKVGLEKFDAWLGMLLPPGRHPLIKDIGRVVLAGKKAKRRATELKTRAELKHHILPAFGHLRPDQITGLLLQEYEAEERQKGRKSLFNTRKTLLEILRLAKESGYIKALPKWKLSDPDPAPPKFIPAATFRAIRRWVDGPEKLVLFILYYQGARPREVLQYRWEMIRWEDKSIAIPAAIAKTGRARTIPLNSRVARALWPIRKPSGPIFPMKGKPDACRKVYDRGWLEATKDMGLDLAVYNLRDSFITRKLQEGVSSVFIARYVDSSVEMVERKYAVPVNEVMRRVAG